MSSIISQAEEQAGCSAAMTRHLQIVPGQATSYAASAIRPAVLAGLTASERASLWRWCIGVIAASAGLAALLAVAVVVTRSSLTFPHVVSVIGLVNGHRAILFAAIGLASLLSSIGGFAFSAICSAMLFHLGDDPVQVVQIMMTCSIANQAKMTWELRRDVDWTSATARRPRDWRSGRCR
jgi:hypothetical protein